MKILLFGATGMIGRGVLHECLQAADVEEVLAVGRGKTGVEDAKLRELVHADLFDLAPIEASLRGFDACFFCLGASAAGMSEADYRRLTFDLTLGVARTLARLRPEMTFVYVSGAGTGGSAMWARVKGETEAALLALPFAGRYMFRPGYIQPMRGVRSRTALYRVIYTAVGPLYPLLSRLFPRHVTTSEIVGRAMLAVARRGTGGEVVEAPAINALGKGAEPG